MNFQESCRFVDNASQVITGIGKCINHFGDMEEFKKSWNDLTTAHCPYQFDKQMSKQHHFQVSWSNVYKHCISELTDELFILNTVKPRKFEVLGTRDFISNYQ